MSNWLIAILLFSSVSLLSIQSVGLEPDENLIGYWKFNEGTGNITYDETINNNSGLINYPNWTEGFTGYALQYNCDENYVDLGSSEIFNLYEQITIMSWVKTSSNYDMTVLGRGLNWFTDHTFAHEVENGKNTFYWADGYSFGISDMVSGTVNINDGDWHHITAIANGTRIEVYTDGIYDNGKNKITHPYSNTELKVYVGNLPGYSEYFNGVIDEVRIYNRSLTPDEIYDEYKSYFPEPTPTPTPTPVPTETPDIIGSGFFDIMVTLFASLALISIFIGKNIFIVKVIGVIISAIIALMVILDLI